MSDIVQVSDIRARGLPRSRLLFAPTTCVEIHTRPGGAATSRSSPVESSTTPSWPQFHYQHTIPHSCGSPFEIALVIRDASSPTSSIILGRAILPIDTAFTQGWYVLNSDNLIENSSPPEIPSFSNKAIQTISENDSSSSSPPFSTSSLKHSTSTLSYTTAEIHCRIVRFQACLMRPLRYNPDFSCTSLMEQFHLISSRENELRTVADEPGKIFRSGELFVTVVADNIHASAKKPFVRVSTDDQLLLGNETEKSKTKWIDTLLHEASTEATSQLEEFMNADKAGEEGQLEDVEEPLEQTQEHEQELDKERSRKREIAGKVLADSGKLAITTAGRTGAKLFASKHVGRPRSSSSSSIDNVKSTMNTLRNYRSASSQRNNEEKVTSSDSPQQSIPLSSTDSKEKHSQSLSQSKERNKRNSYQHIDEDGDSVIPVTGDSKPKNSTEQADFEEASNDPNVVQSTSEIAYPSVLSRRRRNVNFGCFRFAVIKGAEPKVLQVQVIDGNRLLPGPLTHLANASFTLPDISEFKCNCVQSCNSWMMKFVHKEISIGSPRGSLKISILFKSFAPISTFTNVTPRFQEIFPQISEIALTFKEEYPQAEQLTYLFIGGLFTDHYPNYFKKNLNFLQEEFCLPRVQTVPIHTEGSVERNAKIIRDSVLKTCRGAKSIVLLGHSKGGVDAIAVIEKYPETRTFIKGIITFQAPFGGTYLIDYVSQSQLAVSAITSVIKNVVKGDQNSLEDMRYAVRHEAIKPWIKGNSEHTHGTEDEDETKKESEQDVNDEKNNCLCSSNNTDDSSERIHCLGTIPIISFASYASFDPLGIRNPAGAAGIASMAPAAQKILQHTGFQCDGLVTQCDALAPGSDAILLHDMMHTEPALFFPGTKYDPGHLTGASIVLLLEKINRDGNRCIFSS